jgi:hypothetical protein
MAGSITSSVTSKIKATNFFTLVDPTEIARLVRNRENIENHVDAQFIGNIVTLNVTDGNHQEERRVRKGNVTYTETYTVYDRDVELAFSYNFKRARDGSLVGVVTKRGKNSDHSEKQGSLKSASVLAQAIVASRLETLAHDVAPYTAKETVELVDETSKAKGVAARMKEASAAVKAGNYKQALNLYVKVYEEFGTFASGYNAAILYRVTGDPDGAIAVLEDVVDKIGNPKASTELARLEKLRDEKDAINDDKSRSGSTNDQLIATVFADMVTKIPSGAKLAVVNTSGGADKTLGDYIASGLTASLSTKRFTLIDREDTRLSQREKEYQMSGNVRDEDFVGIGEELGVNTFVVVKIAGISSLKRLEIKVLDVKTQKILYTASNAI